MTARDRDLEAAGRNAAPLQPGEGADQLGFRFEEPTAAPVKTGARPAENAGNAPKRRSRARQDTLPAWARAAMSSPTEESDDDEPEQRIWRVAELVSDVRASVEGAYADLLVRGEISNMRAAPSGHLYFTLKDGEAQLPAVMFRRQAQLLRFRPEDGLEVLLRGRVSVYEQRGQMQLVAESLEPVGAGSLQVAFEQLKAKLAAEGLFAMDRKRPLPAFPHCVGIVTSPAGAVIRDFLNVAGRRHAALDVLLFPAAVQGDAAAAEIAAGIAYFNQARAPAITVDVIVIARGGGSLEDLAPFNSELVARAIAASRLPVVSAVGHETDFTIADFVADLRAPTPSAAAELITAAQHRIEDHVDTLSERLVRAAQYACALAQKQYAGVGADGSLARVRDALGRRAQRLDELRFRLERAERAAVQTIRERLERAAVALLRHEATRRLTAARERLLGLEPRLARALAVQLARAQAQHASAAGRLLRLDAPARVQHAQQRLDAQRTRLLRAIVGRVSAAAHQHAAAFRALQALSPRAVLERGYALVFAEDGTLLTEPAGAAAGDLIEVQFAAGALRASVLPNKNTEGA